MFYASFIDNYLLKAWSNSVGVELTAADRALAYPNENPHGRIDFHRSSVETKVELHSYTNSYTTHLVVVLLFLEVVGDVALVLTELFLGVTKFPCYR